MFRIAYVNGRYARHDEAFVHVEDRGYQFADGVYEVIAVWNGIPVDLDLHMARMARGLTDLAIRPPMTPAALKVVMRQVLKRNRVRDGMLYMQISRGVAPRNHLFPKNTAPSVVVMARNGLGPSTATIEGGVRVVSRPDLRWLRRDIKSVSLLPNVLAKQSAAEAGAYEAWLTEPEGTVTEASASNAWIVDGQGRLVTRPLGPDILAGITRHVVADLARTDGLEVVERPFTLDEAKGAREAFITATTAFVLPVVRIDDETVANGRPGPVAQRLRALYLDRLETLTPEKSWA